ncbi:Gfo/Idh/MocA family protein [Jiangella asiatica]|nr:Gfo/Idh/MocA family oxidoreductase [Jiangella asiatica]
MTRLRVGLVGAGWWARQTHLPELAGHPDAEVAAVCDPDGDRAAAAAQCGAVVVPDVDGVLAAGVDAVVVATPHDEHAAAAEPCLAAGVDVLVEKPMTLDPGQAWRLVRIAAETGARLHTGFTYVHGGPARRLRDLVRDGAVGDVTLLHATFATAVHRLYRGQVGWQQVEESAAVSSLPDTYAAPARGGGQLWAQSVHAVSLLLWVTGLVPRQVHAAMDAAGLAVDLSNALTMTFTSGAVGTAASSGAVGAHDRRIEEYRVVGLDGHALLDTVAGRLQVVSARDGDADATWPEKERNPVGAPVRCLVDAALGRAEVVADGTLGAWTTAVAWAAAEAARTGRPVDVPGPGAAAEPDDRADC